MRSIEFADRQVYAFVNQPSCLRREGRCVLWFKSLLHSGPDFIRWSICVMFLGPNLTMNWWWTDHELMMNWWWAADKLLIKPSQMEMWLLFWTIFGQSLDHLWPFLDHFWINVGRIWTIFGPFLYDFWTNFWSFRIIFGPFVAILDHFWPLKNNLSPFLDHFWTFYTIFEPFLDPFGLFWTILELFLEHFWKFLKPFWIILDHFWTILNRLEPF